MATKDQTARLKAHEQRCAEVLAEWASRSYCHPPARFPEFPQDLADLVCGAKTRAGTPCKQKAIYTNGRCKFHGGLATGPTTEAGKAQARINGKKGGRPRKFAALETEPHEHGKETVRVDGVYEAAAPERVVDVLGRVMVQPETEPGKSKPMDARENKTLPVEILPAEMLKDVNVSEVLHRCADCGNLSAAWLCQAAARGEIKGGSEYRPVLSELRNCPFFKHWKT